MKKILAITISAALMLSLSACGGSAKKAEAPTETTVAATTAAETAAPAPEQAKEQETREGDGSDMTVATQYTYDLKENDDLFIEKTIFNEDVIIKGDFAKITFAYCDFNGNIINESPEGTKVFIGEGNIFKDGCKCILRNGAKEGSMEYDTPKFMLWIPVEVVSEDCIGAVTSFNGIEINFNGKKYTIKDSTLFMDEAHPENGLVPYEGQEANFLYVGRWWENGEEKLLVLCENMPM